MKSCTQRIPQSVLTVSPKVDMCKPLVSGRTAAEVGYADAVRRTVRIEPEAGAHTRPHVSST